MHSSKPPDEFELVLHDDRRINLRLIGPSAQGWVCATKARDACYRLLPINGGYGGQRECEDTPVERRQAFRGWMAGAPSAPAWMSNPLIRHLAPITDEGQGQLATGDHQGWYCVRYEIPHTTSLAEILAGPDPHARLDAVILVLYRIQNWWLDLRPGLVPFAADIVFDSDKRPFLLAAPAWKYPDIGSLFSEPSRVFLLAPEYLCGRTDGESGGNIDRFALGALGLQAFRRIHYASDAKYCLPRAATGSLWENLASNIPLWLQRLRATAEAETALRHLITPDPLARAAIDLPQLVQTLERCRRRMEPIHAVREFLDGGRADEAYALLQDILFVDDSHAMLILAAEVARQSGRLLEAVDMLEKAIHRASDDIEAYRQQFNLLMSESCRERIKDLLPQQPELATRVDEKMWRDFCFLEAADPSFEWENEFVDYMIWRDMEIYAVPFIYCRLFDAERNFLWWKFPLRFRYVRALFHAGRQMHSFNRHAEGDNYFRCSRAELESIKTALFIAHHQGRIEPDLREYYFRETHDLEQLVNLFGLPPNPNPS